MHSGTTRIERELRLTVADVKARIVNHLRGRGWVPIGDIIPFLLELRCTRHTGDQYLRDLALTGRVERRRATEGLLRPYEYRVP